jgi:hypothetical protein
VPGWVLAFVLFYEGGPRARRRGRSGNRVLVPISGVLTFVLVLGERAPPTLALGGAIVLAGLSLAQTPRSVAGWLLGRGGVGQPTWITKNAIATYWQATATIVRVWNSSW